jgi:outer membrane protein TolC
MSRVNLRQFAVLWSAALALCPLLGVSTARAEVPAATSYSPPEYISRPPVLPPHLEQKGPRAIALHDAIERVLQDNLRLAIEREEVRVVDTMRSSARARFEPILQLSLSRDKQQQPPATAQEGVAGQVLLSTRDAWGLRLANQLPTGTQLSLDFGNFLIDSTLGTAVAPRLFRSSLLFNLSQPILRGFSFNGHVQMAPLLKARFDSESVRQRARLAAMSTLKSTEDAYWMLVERWKAYEVNRSTQELAEKQRELTRRRIEAGVQPESELISADATLAQRQVAVVLSESAIEEAADALRQLLNLPAGEWQAPLVPLDAPNFAQFSVSFDAAMERALASRPELKQADFELRKSSIDLEVARNQRLPQLNLSSSVGIVGQDEDYGQALGQVGSRAGWQWRVGMDFAWEPLGIGARAEIRRQHSVLRQKGINREQLALNIRLDVRAAIRAIETAERQLYTSAKYRELAERSLEIEQRRFMSGMSGNLQVAQRQELLASAKLGELSALIQHKRAGTLLQMAMGELLEARQVQFEVRGDS